MPGTEVALQSSTVVGEGLLGFPSNQSRANSCVDISSLAGGFSGQADFNMNIGFQGGIGIPWTPAQTQFTGLDMWQFSQDNSDSSGTTSTPQMGHVPPSPSTDTPHTGLGDLTDVAKAKVASICKDFLRQDHSQILQCDFPRWERDGLFNDHALRGSHSSISTSQATYGSSQSHYQHGRLELVYSYVCQLDVRQSDDAIRSRIALIWLHRAYAGGIAKGRRRRDSGAHTAALHYQRPAGERSTTTTTTTTTGVGRGESTMIIDEILANIHPEWRGLGDEGRTELRARFHNRKRYALRPEVGTGSKLFLQTKYNGHY
ncbi:hypothetical protein VMCG_08349 [Cytospora schulzeri]|uniref:Uncharacterized protein n=1 Tax=Cytospora schulzeri TaxID=448051 RepID=A0A423VV68_9PEZI|nr:hypothetical protein VMCG_08349 [Valsa malicola]